jgi:ribosomal protein S20
VVTTGDAAKAEELALKAFQIMDKAAKTRTIHPNKAARHKSQVMRAVGGIKKK